MSPLVIGIIIAVYALIVWGLMFYAWRQGYREWKRMRARRICRVRAWVADKRRASEYAEPEEQEVARCFITFEYDGGPKEFPVSEPVYSASRIGGEGTLVLQAGEYQDFEPKSPGDETDEVYRRMVKG